MQLCILNDASRSRKYYFFNFQLGAFEVKKSLVKSKLLCKF